MAERGWAFLARAGTVIFAVTIVVWALAYYPRSEERVAADIAAQRAADRRTIRRRSPNSTIPRTSNTSTASLHQRYSFLGRAGQWIEPVVRPLGWDWRIGCAAIASFPAREVVMGVLGVIYNLGPDVDVGAEGDQNRLQRSAPRGPLGRHGRAGVQSAGGAVDHGVLRAVRSVRGDAGRDPPRNEQLALAGVHVRVHDGAGVRRRRWSRTKLAFD